MNTGLAGSRDLISRQGIGTIAQYGVNGETPEEQRAALRCIANALLLDADMRQVFVDTGLAGKLAERLKVGHSTAICVNDTDWRESRPTIPRMRWFRAASCSFQRTILTWTLGT